jgi:hypothetical protein
MAVVVAPCVEEVMFRGAFYSWLREYCSATFSIITSAVIFAAIHPQGLIGLVPLTFIGVILAIVREWRGTLSAAIATHACFNAGTLIVVLLLFRE